MAAIYQSGGGGVWRLRSILYGLVGFCVVSSFHKKYNKVFAIRTQDNIIAVGKSNLKDAADQS